MKTNHKDTIIHKRKEKHHDNIEIQNEKYKSRCNHSASICGWFVFYIVFVSFVVILIHTMVILCGLFVLCLFLVASYLVVFSFHLFLGILSWSTWCCHLVCLCSCFVSAYLVSLFLFCVSDHSVYLRTFFHFVSLVVVLCFFVVVLH